jgi:phosphatidate cytidylyltransferase
VTRVLSASVLLTLVIVTVWWLPPGATVVVAAAFAWLAAVEVAGLSRHLGAPLPVGFVGPAAAILCGAFAFGAAPDPASAPASISLVLFSLLIATGAVVLAMGPPGPSTLARASGTLMAPMYAGLPLGAIAWVQVVHGPYVLTALALLLVASDSAQYFTGRAIGRHKLAPTVSPAKTVEGAVGGLVASGVIGALLLARWIPGVAPGTGALLGLTLGALGIVGDLFESLLKRSAGVKDSSALIPGHGGVLDRIDSWLFAAPGYFVFLRYFV